MCELFGVGLKASHQRRVLRVNTKPKELNARYIQNFSDMCFSQNDYFQLAVEETSQTSNSSK